VHISRCTLYWTDFSTCRESICKGVCSSRSEADSIMSQRSFELEHVKVELIGKQGCI
jgi:hypothetical protein